MNKSTLKRLPITCQKLIISDNDDRRVNCIQNANNVNVQECKALKLLKSFEKYLEVLRKLTNLNEWENKYFKGGKNTRGIRVSSYDPDESSQHTHNVYESGQPKEPQAYNVEQNKTGAAQQPPTLGSTRKFSTQKVATISQNYNEKSMLLSSDEE